MAYWWMLIGSAFFAAMGLLTESLGDEYSFLWIALIRSVIAAVVSGAMVLLAGEKFLWFHPWRLWIRSLAGTAAMFLMFFAMTHYEASIVLALTSTYPVWIALLSWPLLRVWPSRSTWLAMAVCIAGMATVYGASAGAKPMDARVNYLPQLAIPLAAGAAVFSAIALIGLHKLKELDSRVVVTHFSSVSASLALVGWWLIPSDAAPYQPESSGPTRLLLLGGCAVLGQLFLTKAFAAGPPARISVVGLSQVAFAVVYKWFFEHRIPSGSTLLGMALILVATIWVMTHRSNIDESTPTPPT